MDPQQQWYRVTVPQGRKYGKAWLLSTLQSACILHFTPVEFHFSKRRARFYLEGAEAANVLNQLSQRIADPDGIPIYILVVPCGASPSLQSAFQGLLSRDRSPIKPVDGIIDSELDSKNQWYRVTVLNGRRYKKAWLLLAIQRRCRLFFKLSEFQYKGTKARFFVQGPMAANAIQRASEKIVDEDGRVVTFMVKLYGLKPPPARGKRSRN